MADFLLNILAGFALGWLLTILDQKARSSFWQFIWKMTLLAVGYHGGIMAASYIWGG